MTQNKEVAAQENVPIAKRKHKAKLPFATIIAVVVVCIFSFYAWLELQDIEQATLEVCATQQDGYVQLVIDQINLKENRTDEEIINNILSTLDSSASKYWAFSRDQTMLFVKDVAETNKYKGFTAATFYGTSSASGFIESLEVNTVTHEFIEINDSTFLASGSLFEYEDTDYKIVLLTNKSALLDNNTYMGAHSRLGSVIYIVLTVSFIIVLSLVRTIDLKNKSIDEKDVEFECLYQTNKSLSDKLLQNNNFNNKLKLWAPKTLDKFVQKIDQSKLLSTFVNLQFCTDEAKTNFLQQSSIIFDEKVVRIDDANLKLLLIFLNQEENQALRLMKPLLNEEIKIVNTYSVNGESNE